MAVSVFPGNLRQRVGGRGVRAEEGREEGCAWEIVFSGVTTQYSREEWAFVFVKTTRTRRSQFY